MKLTSTIRASVGKFLGLDVTNPDAVGLQRSRVSRHAGPVREEFLPVETILREEERVFHHEQVVSTGDGWMVRN
jgi:hypothetical protein